MPRSVEVELETAGSTVHVSLRNEILVSNFQPVKEALLRALESPAQTVEIDLSGVPYMDSTGLGMLLEIQRVVKETKGRLRLLRPSEQVMRALKVMALDQVFEIEA